MVFIPTIFFEKITCKKDSNLEPFYKKCDTEKKTYSKVSMIKPGHSKLLVVERKIVLFV